VVFSTRYGAPGYSAARQPDEDAAAGLAKKEEFQARATSARLTPLNAIQPAWESALAGRSGITRISRFDPSRLASQIAGEVKGFDVAPYMSPKEARRMDIFIQYGMAAALQAWRECGLQVTAQNAERVGVNFGSGIGGLPLIEAQHQELRERGPRRISPFFVPGTIINMTAGLISIELGAKGPNSPWSPPAPPRRTASARP
jgi:3-oxoacyl-(acyl-carrier-protein) synthase